MTIPALGAEGKLPNYELAARRAAKKYGVDPDIFVAQLRQESGLRMGPTSSAGARDIAQFMPATAKQYGVKLGDGRASDDLDGAARYMRDNLNRTDGDYKAALSIYNSGRPDAYKDPGFADGQTYNYVNKIMGAADKPAKQPKLKKNATPSGAQPSTETATTTTTPGVDNSGLRRQLVGSFLAEGGVKNTSAVLNLAAQYGGAQDTPGTTTTSYATAAPGAAEKPVPGSVLNKPTTGSVKALQWAESKIGQPGSKETGGENRGKLADYANSRFGMSGQPWCAMFTSLAVTKGGAPKTARTASVQEVRRQAEQGGGGYQKGFVDASRARPGDMVLWGNDHIGMVQRVKGGKVYYVAGNESDTVAEGVADPGEVEIVRPKYGKRSKK